MKDKAMLAFYKAQVHFDSATAYPKWCIWCAEHSEQPGSCDAFIERLKRCHLAQLRLKPARHGSTPTAQVGHP